MRVVKATHLAGRFTLEVCYGAYVAEMVHLECLREGWWGGEGPDSFMKADIEQYML
jgi:hypothetical protein